MRIKMKGGSPIARNDGVDRIVARNNNLTAKQIGNVERHNERQKDSYVNPDIVAERTPLNYHYKSPAEGYETAFAGMVAPGAISTRGLKPDAKTYGEMIIDVNSAYFHNHGGYEFAKRFYADAYKAAVRVIGDEAYVLSAVLHADERNSKMTKALGQDVYHYHLHIVYIPVVEKEIRYSKRCKDKALVGKVKEVIRQVSASKKWASVPATDADGKPILGKNGKPVMKKSYSQLQDDIFAAMRGMGYTDIERGEKHSGEEHLTVTQFKIRQEEETLTELEEKEQRLAETIAADEKKAAIISAKTAKLRHAFDEEFPDAEQLLPDPKTLESAAAYRKRILPTIAKIIKKARTLLIDNIHLKQALNKSQEESSRRQGVINRQAAQIDALNAGDRTLSALIRKFGNARIAAWAQEAEQQPQDHGKRKENHRTHER